VLDLHTDASVRGRLLGPGRRARAGPAFAAWCGWHECALPDRPSFSGQAYIGIKSTQQAAYQAAIHGLSAALAYVVVQPDAQRPERLVLHVDNRPVLLIMSGARQARAMAPYNRATLDLRGALVRLGLEASINLVSEKVPAHRIVHDMCKQAVNQVLPRKDWRPTDE
jgi:hypothetical protein